MTYNRKEWSQAEDAILRQIFATGASFGRMAEDLGRRPSSIYSRVSVLGLERQKRPSMSIAAPPAVPTLAYVPYIKVTGRYKMRGAHVE